MAEKTQGSLSQSLGNDIRLLAGLVEEMEGLSNQPISRDTVEIIGKRLAIAKPLAQKIRSAFADMNKQVSERVAGYEATIRSLEDLAEPPYFVALFERLCNMDDPRAKRRQEKGVDVKLAWLILDNKEIVGTVSAKLALSLRSEQLVLLNDKYAILGAIPDKEVRSLRALHEATVSAVMGDLIMVADGQSRSVRSAVPASALADELAAKPLAEGSRVALFGNVIVRVLERPPSITTPESVEVVTFEDVGGLEKQIEEINDLLGIGFDPEALKKMRGEKLAQGVILCGPPGCGKNHLVKAYAHATKRFLQVINGSQVENKFVGEGPRAIREAFGVAKKNAPSFMVIDEAEAVFPVRGSSSRDYTASYVAQYNTIMNGMEKLGDVFVFLLTNRIDQLDPSVIRPGRLDKKIEILPPKTPEQAMAILRTHFRNQPIAASISETKEALKQKIMEKIVERLLAKDESTLLFTAFFEHERDFFYKDFISGALLAGIISQLELRALKRLRQEKIPVQSDLFGIALRDVDGLVDEMVQTTVPHERRTMEHWLLNNGYPAPRDVEYYDRAME